VFITGIGVVRSGRSGNEAFLQGCRGIARRVGAGYGRISEEQYIHLLNARRIRRMSDQVKLTLRRRRSRARTPGLRTWRLRAAVQRDPRQRARLGQLQRGVLQ